jgi:hypothetical protein
VKDLYAKSVQTVGLQIKALWHPTLLVLPVDDTVLEGQAPQIAIELVSPLMVGANKASFIAIRRLEEPHSSVSAAVLDHPNAVIDVFLRGMNMVANHDDFTLSDLGFFEISQFWDFSQEAHIAPMCTIKYFAEFFGMNTGVGVDPKGNATGLSALPSGVFTGLGGEAFIHDG